MTAAPTGPSPCIGTCSIDQDDGLCRGCRRNLDEIAAWGRLGIHERSRIMAALPSRGRPSAAVR